MKLRYDGKVSGLLRTMDEAGIDMALTLGVAEGFDCGSYERVHRIRASRPLRSRFGIPGAVARGESAPPPDNDIRGVKLHLLFQSLAPDDPRIVEILAGPAECGSWWSPTSGRL